MKAMKCVLIAALAMCSVDAGEVGGSGRFKVYSMLTRDGRRLVSRMEGTNEVFELVAADSLPAGLPPVREWRIFAVKATHTDIGLHNSQYIQRHGSVVRMDAASRLVADDPDDSDPAAFRYVAEGAWFWGNYPQDRGEDKARAIVANEMARGRIDVGVTCAGNHTHLYGFEELCRSIYTKRELETRWGVRTKTMLMTDNPGMSWSIVGPYSEAGVENVLFSPNQWNPHPSTIWRRDESKVGWQWNPDAAGGGNRIDVRYDSALPMVFWWEGAEGRGRMLVWCSTQYDKGGSAFGIRTSSGRSVLPLDKMEPVMARQLAKMDARCPYDVWLFSDYADDEFPSRIQSDLFKRWNAKWKWPELHTVGRLDEPFEMLKSRWGDKMPVLRGEMTSGWLQHAACTPELLARKFAADRALPLAEALSSVAAIAKGAEYPREDLGRAWDALVWNDEHSYGTSGYKGRRVFETWMQHRDWIERAETVASNELARAVAALGAEPARAEPERLVLCADGATENEWYRVVATNGVLHSIYDKELGRELLEGPANEFRYTRDNHRTWERDPAAALTGDAAGMSQRAWLAADEKKIVVETSFAHARDLFNKSRYNRFGYLAFPFAVPQFKFAAQLNGPVIDPVRDQSGFATDAYVGARDWCAVENGEFGVALVQADSCLVEFGAIHPDKTCYGGPIKSSGLYSYLFTDWLQMHNPDGESFNPRFRYAITSYAGNWKNAHIPAFAARAVAGMGGRRTPTDALRPWISCDAPGVELISLKAAEDGRGWIARFRETDERPAGVAVRQSLFADARFTLCTVTERDVKPLGGFAFDLPPFGYATVRIEGKGAPAVKFRPSTFDGPCAYTGLITRPRAGHGEKNGQMYVLWGVNAAKGFDHDELHRSERADFTCGPDTFVAKVVNEAPGGVAYRVMRHEDLGLKHHARYWYRVVPVFKDGRKGEASPAFCGITRGDESGT